MTAPAVCLAPTDKHLVDAIAAMEKWQKKLTDRKYNPDANAERLADQQQVARAALASAADLSAVVRAQADDKAIDIALQTMPSLALPVTAAEFDARNWETDLAFHAALTAGGTRRGHAHEYGWWHLLTLSLLQHGGRLPDPPVFLLEPSGGGLPFRRESLTETHDGITDEERKRIDDAMRNLLRRSGGIFHRKARLLIDAPLAKAWWLIELSQAAESDLPRPLTPRDAYEALLAGWPRWADLAARSVTRLADPSCVAAYVYVAASKRDETGGWPKGEQSNNLTRALIRRTQNLCVRLVDAKHLAELALAD